MIRTAAVAIALVACLSVRADGRTRVSSSQAVGSQSAQMNASATSESTVSLELQGADLRAALRALAALAGVNLVLHPAVEGRVDLALRDVPWPQALDAMLRTHQLGVEREGAIARVAPTSVFASEAAERRKRLEERQREDALSQRVVRALKLDYAKAQALAPLVKKVALSPFGDVSVDEATNTLIVVDLPEGLTRAEGLVASLDVSQPQVEIEARIVQTTRDWSSELGVRLGLTAEATSRLGNTLPLVFPNQAVVAGQTGLEAEGRDQVGALLGSVGGAVRLDVVLSALEREGKARVLSAPRVTTQNNVEAEVQQGTQIPYVTAATPIPGSDGNDVIAALQPPTVQFKDASLKLKVTPHITSGNAVLMRVELERSAPDFANVIPGNPNPPIATSKAVATVQVGDGETTVVGGVLMTSETSSVRRTPGLHHVPLIGWLFRDRVEDEAAQELLLFITPRILRRESPRKDE
jgi:type IV pilus assembly protein PilQ